MTMRRPTLAALAPTRKRQRNTPCFNNKFWSQEDDQRLLTLVASCPSPPDWSHIAHFFPLKSETQVFERWAKVLDPSLLKGSWTRGEDETIINFVTRNGTKSWAKLSELLPGRLGKQCRERWFNALDPKIDRGPWTEEEDQTLIELHAKYGNHWRKIGDSIPRRSDNAIKNRWHSTLSKRSELATPAPTPVISRPRMRLPSIAMFTAGPYPKCGDLQSLTFGELTKVRRVGAIQESEGNWQQSIQAGCSSP
jgi:hypothetical protein